MRHFSTLVQFHHYPHDNPPLSNEDNAAKIWHISLRFRLDYQSLFGKMIGEDQRPDPPGDGGNRAYLRLNSPSIPSSQALSLRELYEENDDMTPGVFTIMAHQGQDYKQ